VDLQPETFRAEALASALAADALKRMGFSQPMSLAGGILNWEDHGYPVKKPGKEERVALVAVSAC